jgi:hypothetical protein
VDTLSLFKIARVAVLLVKLQLPVLAIEVMERALPGILLMQ